MKSAPTGLITLLGTGQFVFCDLYVFTLTSGQVLRYTTADVDVTYGGNRYSSALFIDTIGSSGGSGSKATGHWKTGFDVDTWQVYVMPVDVDPITLAPFPITIGNEPWLAAVAAGALAGATVDIHRAYWPSWPQPWTSPLAAYADGSGTYVIVDYFAGRVAAVDVMRNQAVISINSWLDQFNLLMPRNLWQASCRHTLFDAGCQLNQASYAHAYSAQAGSRQDALVINAGAMTPTFTLGQVVMTSGANAGLRRMVKVYDGAALFLIAPLPFAVALGDTFTVYPGCDKTLNNATGCAGFGNQANFGGQDLIPVPETAI